MQPPSAGKIKRQHADEQSPHAAAVYFGAGVLVYISQCLTALNTFFKGNYFADAVGELILSRVGMSFLWRRKALRPYGSSPILIRQQHHLSSHK